MSGPESGEFHGQRQSAALAGARVGSIEVVCGSMFSGKTEELLRRIKRAKIARRKVQLFKPRVDNRYDAVKVVTHEGVNADAVPVSSVDEMLSLVDWKEASVVGVDEAQFFDPSLLAACERMANSGIRVICAGLDQDYKGEPFGLMPQLMAIAEYVSKLHAVCAQCGGEASRTQRLVAQEEQLFVGGAAAYEARCRMCFRAGVVESGS
jgi:thymidine kinase